ncbi:DUF202 domain-containing protein [Arthrobacter sp. MPF02]|uniref:DUF202 domain-containing protein n=1 Tax=Arthrobacter sp. MPF02 TaxID=3388492 RepID=UPI00398539FD
MDRAHPRGRRRPCRGRHGRVRNGPRLLTMPVSTNRPTHNDPGLQPERTDLAWSRTALSLVVSAATFLRWLPHHGLFVGTLVAAAIVTALFINLSRKHRFHQAIHGIQQERMTPDIASTAAIASSTVILAILGIYTVLLLPFAH